MAKGKKSKSPKKPKETREDSQNASATVETEGKSDLLASPEEVQISFNIITRLYDQIEKATNSKIGTTILSKDVERAQRLCVELLGQHPSLVVDPEIDCYDPQVNALKELARAKRETDDAVLREDEVGALQKIVTKFPRNIVLDSRYVGKGRREPYLRIMTTRETKEAKLKDHHSMVHNLSNLRYMARSDFVDNFSPMLEEIQKDPNGYEPDLNELIMRLTPTARNGSERRGVTYHYFPPIVGEPDTVKYKKGGPIQHEAVSHFKVR
jgi:hypothetical protein